MPSAKGMIMLAWLIDHHGFVSFILQHFQIQFYVHHKHKSINPIWLKNCRLPTDCGGKRNAVQPGKYTPASEGPSSMPAAISPITAG